MMTATITIGDNTIEISGKGPGAAIANTCATEIEMAVEEYQESLGTQGSAPAPAAAQVAQPVPVSAAPSQKAKGSITPDEYLEYQNKAIAIIKQYKELFDNNILTEEEFKAKKEDLLNFINGMMH